MEMWFAVHWGESTQTPRIRTARCTGALKQLVEDCPSLHKAPTTTNSYKIQLSPTFVESIETQLFIHVTDGQFAACQQLGSQQRKLSRVRDDLDRNSLAEPIHEADECFKGYP
jgi:hypothetical protein